MRASNQRPAFVTAGKSCAPRVVKLFETVAEHVLLLVLFNEGAALADHVVLVERFLEVGRDRGVIAQHEPAHTVALLQVRRALGQRNLNRGWAPRDEVDEVPLADAQERLVDLFVGEGGGQHR